MIKYIPFMCYAKNDFKLFKLNKYVFQYSKLDCRFTQGKLDGE